MPATFSFELFIIPCSDESAQRYLAAALQVLPVYGVSSSRPANAFVFGFPRLGKGPDGPRDSLASNLLQSLREEKIGAACAAVRSCHTKGMENGSLIHVEPVGETHGFALRRVVKKGTRDLCRAIHRSALHLDVLCKIDRAEPIVVSEDLVDEIMDFTSLFLEAIRSKRLYTIATSPGRSPSRSLQPVEGPQTKQRQRRNVPALPECHFAVTERVKQTRIVLWISWLARKRLRIESRCLQAIARKDVEIDRTLDALLALFP